MKGKYSELNCNRRNCGRVHICKELKNPRKECTHTSVQLVRNGRFLTVYHEGMLHCLSLTEWSAIACTDRNTLLHRLASPNWNDRQTVGIEPKPSYKIHNPHKRKKSIVHRGGDSYYKKTKPTFIAITDNVMLNIFLMYVPTFNSNVRVNVGCMK